MKAEKAAAKELAEAEEAEDEVKLDIRVLVFVPAFVPQSFEICTAWGFGHTRLVWGYGLDSQVHDEVFTAPMSSKGASNELGHWSLGRW